ASGARCWGTSWWCPTQWTNAFTAWPCGRRPGLPPYGETTRMTIELTIRAETTDELKEELARLLLANLQAVPSPILPSDASVRQAFNQVYDCDPVQGGPKVQSPDD